MEKLYSIQSKLLSVVSDEFFRFLYGKINWKRRLISIKGPRGAGKTTLMLQFLKYGLKSTDALYASADNPFFYNYSLFELAEEFGKLGGKHLLLDEVHKAPNWSREIKSIYDSFPELQVIFSSSSALDIFRGEADLSRRVEVYELPGMSFREHLNLSHKTDLEAIPLQKLLKNHIYIAGKITGKIKPLPRFKRYLVSGYLPFSNELDDADYSRRLQQIINTVLESDLAVIEGYSAAGTQKIKRLLGLLSETVPFEPNVSAIANKMQLGRDTVLNYFHHLQRARLLNFLNTARKGTAGLQKPDKIYLENTNLSFALKDSPDTGNIRETFALNQLRNAGLEVTKPAIGDLLVNGKIVFEIGGKNKDASQLKGQDESYILSDNIEIGFGRKIPLWLAGFLY